MRGLDKAAAGYAYGKVHLRKKLYVPANVCFEEAAAQRRASTPRSG
jgi:hypothetical protein